MSGPRKIGHPKRKGLQIKEEDGHLDMVPMIDCVFLMLLFFMLCGRISTDMRPEQVTVPPTKTAEPLSKTLEGWTIVVVNVFGSTQASARGKGNIPRNSISWNNEPAWVSAGVSGDSQYEGYRKLRERLDLVFDRAEKYKDPKDTKLPDGTPMMLPKAVIEIRADADTEYRVVQEIQQILTDTIDPKPNGEAGAMQPKPPTRPFVNLRFTTRLPTDKS